jgi:hypothetical protein
MIILVPVGERIDKLANCSWQAMLDHLFTLVCYQVYELEGKSKINEDFG